MYTRPPQGRFPRGMRIPQNYSGNTFRPTAEERDDVPSDIPAPYYPTDLPSYSPPIPEPEEIEAESTPTEDSDEPTEKQDAVPVSRKGTEGFHFSLRNLFPSLGKEGSGLGSEELLLLALVLLLSGSEGNDDLILLLILLLLVK